MDHAAGTICLENMGVLCGMTMVLCDVRSELCGMSVYDNISV